jgi:hypothetical protein
MKKILTTLAVTGLTIAAIAQGTVQWEGSGGLLIVQTNSTDYSTFGANPGQANANGTVGNISPNTVSLYYFELLTSATATTAPTTATQLAGWSDTGLWASNTAAGNGHIAQGAPSSDNTAANWPAGTAQNVVLVGWSANIGGAYAAALTSLQNWSTAGVANAYFGVSTVGNLTSGTANPGVIIFGANAGQIDNPGASPLQLDALGVASVPEPGTLALAALGGASLLMFRRKK